MSAEHSYQFRVQAAERARLEALVKQRHLQQARLRFEQAQRALEQQRLRQRAQRLSEQDQRDLADARRQLDQLGREQADQAARGRELQHETAALRQNLPRTTSALTGAERQLALARAALEDQIAATKTLGAGTEREHLLLQSAIGDAKASLANTDRTAERGVQQAEALGAAASAGNRLAQAQAEVAEQLQQVERELRFLNVNADLQPAAMAVLAGMEANGYRLQETLIRGDLTAYFAHCDADRTIAVRLVPDRRPGEQPERWELLAETFAMAGDTCLDELKNFDTAMETLALGELLAVGGVRNFPKAEHSGELERSGSLPRPRFDPRRARGTAASKATVKG